MGWKPLYTMGYRNYIVLLLCSSTYSVWRKHTMKIERETTVLCANKQRKAVKTNIPAIFRDIMGLKKGDKLLWKMENENEIQLRKK